MICGFQNSLWHWLRLEQKYLPTLQLLDLLQAQPTGRYCCGPVPLKPSATWWRQHSVDATMRREQAMATAWWWIPGERWWPAALKDQASALPGSTSVTCGSCANTCPCSSTAGLTSMAVWATRRLKTLTSGS